MPGYRFIPRNDVFKMDFDKYPGVNICPKNPKVFHPEKKVFPKKLLIFSGFDIFNQNSEGRSFSHRNTPCFKNLKRKNSSLKV